MGSLFNPSLHSLDPRNGMCVLTAAFGFGEQSQGVVSRLAGERMARRVFAIVLQFLFSIFKRIALVAEHVFYQLAHLHICGTVFARSSGRSERVKLLEGILPEAQGRDRDIEHRRHLADLVVGFLWRHDLYLLCLVIFSSDERSVCALSGSKTPSDMALCCDI